MLKILVTGGLGFIGCRLVRNLIGNNHIVFNVDKMTYAGNKVSLYEIESSSNYQFFNVDICDSEAMKHIFNYCCPDVVIHLAAESHVDNSIVAPFSFIQTNIVGTFTLLEVALAYWTKLEGTRRADFRLLHVSTDEVFGDSLNENLAPTESHRYSPSSPYSASKACSDHLVNAWYKTYGLPVMVTRSSNNYGPYQFPEKLIPVTVLNALHGKPILVYGDGKQIRDWIHVDDHVRALMMVISKGRIGESYNIGSNCRLTNLDLVITLCEILEDLNLNKPSGLGKYTDLIMHIPDRPGHDISYSMDTDKIQLELGWKPNKALQEGIKKTVRWYLDNPNWWERLYPDQKI